MRHGKAEAFAREDHQRRLTERGRREATAAGQWLADQGIVPTDAFVSSAIRTRQTWEALVAGSGTPAEARVEDAVYSADAESALDVLREAPPTPRWCCTSGTTRPRPRWRTCSTTATPTPRPSGR